MSNHRAKASNEGLTRDTDDQATGQRRFVPRRSTYWPLRDLLEVCTQKDIGCAETDEFTVLRGAVVSCGQTVIIQFASSLTESEKRLTLAHELAHLALRHLRSTPDSSPAPVAWAVEDGPLSFLRDEGKEQEADIWAAHLLVDPKVYERHFRNIAPSPDNGEAVMHATREVAEELDLPEEVVRLRFDTNGHHFEEDPTHWLSSDRGLLAGRER